MGIIRNYYHGMPARQRKFLWLVLIFFMIYTIPYVPLRLSKTFVRYDNINGCGMLCNDASGQVIAGWVALMANKSIDGIIFNSKPSPGDISAGYFLCLFYAPLIEIELVFQEMSAELRYKWRTRTYY